MIPLWQRIRPRAGNLRWWQVGVLVAVFGCWHLLTVPGLLPNFVFSDDSQAAFFFGEPLKIFARIGRWFFVSRDIYEHLAVTLLETVLAFGLARYRTADDRWHFLAVPRALLYCVANHVYLSARRYIRDDEYDRISQSLEDQLIAEETELHSLKESVQRLEEEMFRRLWRMGRGEYTAS